MTQNFSEKVVQKLWNSEYNDESSPKSENLIQPETNTLSVVNHMHIFFQTRPGHWNSLFDSRFSVFDNFSSKSKNLRQKPAESLPYLVRCYIFCCDLRYSKYKYVYNLYFLHLKSLFLVSHVAFQAWWTCLFNKNEIQTMGELFYFV